MVWTLDLLRDFAYWVEDLDCRAAEGLCVFGRGLGLFIFLKSVVIGACIWIDVLLKAVIIGAWN